MEENDAIAIVGVGGRFPGANNIDEFWQVLLKGENHLKEIPPERWNLEAFYDDDPEASGKTYARKAGLLSNYDEFDHKLFGIHFQEAERMDPQQKYVLECVFMALQDAGITRENIQGTDTAVYIGLLNDDYNGMTSIYDLNHYNVTGGSSSLVSARVSFTFDLRGPCMSVDTACSSALLSIHLGSQALRTGDCNMAVCGGVNAILIPATFVQLTKARMVSPTAQCHTFSADADGYARGEGCGIVLLKRLSDAIRDGDKIWATVVTGTNQDGRTVTPVTAPSGEQQEALLRTAYKRAKMDPSDIDYIEAHGTGTKAGDPVEVQSLGNFFLSMAKQKKRFIGSVKTNIGHLEPAAGVAGLIKVLLMMKNNKIVKSLLTGEQNPNIDFRKFSFEVPTEVHDWDNPKKVSCINSFGFGGSNCHAIVTNYKEPPCELKQENVTPLLFCFSGQNMKGLKDSIQEFISFAETNPAEDIRAISFTSTVRRDHFHVRKAVTANSLNELVGKLKSAQMSESSQRRKRMIFVFGGMGTSWKGMCKELMSEFEVFKEKILEIDSCLKVHVSWSLYERLINDYNVEDSLFGPLSIFACQVALATLWKHLGINPDCIVGQSIGEVAASHIAGVWSLEEAVKIIFYRTSVLSDATGGRMVIFRNISVKELEKLISKYEGRANIALYYSPKSCCVSGDADAVEEVEKACINENGINLLPLKVNTAFHSHHTEKSKDKLQEHLSGMQGSKPDVEIISTVTGKAATESDFTTPAYWADNIRHPVLFGPAIVNAIRIECVNVFVEICPKPVLGSHISDLFTEENVVAVPSMKPNSELSCLMATVGKMYEHGVNFNWKTFFKETEQNTELPRYTFCRNKCLYVSENFRQMLMGLNNKKPFHPFLKTIYYKDSGSDHKIIISPNTIGSVYEHRFSGTILVPAALYGEVGFALGQHYFGKEESKNLSVSLKFRHAVILEKDRNEILDVDIIRTEKPKSVRFVVHKQNKVYVKGQVVCEKSENEKINIDNIRERCPVKIAKDLLYKCLLDFGITFGETLKILTETVRGKTESLSRVSLNPVIKEEMNGTTIHPAVLDAMFQTTAAFYTEESALRRALPVLVDGLRVRRPVEDNMIAYTRLLNAESSSNKLFRIFLLTEEGEVIAEVEKLASKHVGSQKEEIMYEMQWHPSEELQTKNILLPKQKILVIADNKENQPQNGFIYNNMETVLKYDVSSLSPFSAVVFICQVRNTENISGADMLEIVTNCAMNLRRLLMHLSNQSATVPLFIITENAVNIGTDVSVDLVAGSCWGFVRTVMREQIYSSTTIVDVHTDHSNTFHALMSAAVQYLLSEKSRQGIAEFVIDENHIWYQQLFQNEEMPIFRLNKFISPAKATMFSESENSVFHPFYEYDSETEFSLNPNTVDITTTSIVIHNSSLYQQCVPGPQSLTFGTNIITLEGVGNVCGQNHTEQNVAFLFPCNAGSVITVPLRCTINIKNIPFYTPGLLTKLYLLWHHCLLLEKQQEIMNKSKHLIQLPFSTTCQRKLTNIIVLCSEMTLPVAEALALMIETANNKKDIEVQIFHIDSQSTVQTNYETIILSTVQMKDNVIQAIRKYWPDAKYLICMDQLLSNHAAQQLSNYNRMLQIQRIRCNDIFICSSVIATLPKLATWISNKKKYVKKIAERLNVLRKDETDFSVISMMHCSTIDIYDSSGVSPLPVKSTEKDLLRPDGLYVVVGGLTGLGRECVKFLAERGAGAILIMNRREAQRDQKQELKELETCFGCKIVADQVDVTNMLSLENSLKAVEAKLPKYKFKGVFFGAGVLADTTMINMTEDMFQKAASPKIQGAWNMHLLTENIPLDFFIMHSSVAAIFGNPGQSNYGAANAFLDSLAHNRRQAGLAAQSINRGPLKLGMLNEKPELVQALERAGYIPLSTEEIHKCLLSALMLDKPSILAAKFNYSQLAKSILHENNDVLEFKVNSILDIPTAEDIKNDSSNIKQHISKEKLKSMDNTKRLETIREYITELLGNVLSFELAVFDLDKGVQELGLDSMQAMTTSNQINQTFQVRITPAGLLQQNLSVNGITDQIGSSLFNQVNSTDVNTNITSALHEQSLTYMEHVSYKVYSDNPADPSLFFLAELTLPDSAANPELWRKVSAELMSRHEVLRTTFEKVPESENFRWNVKRKVNAVGMKPDFTVLETEQLAEIEQKSKEAFHLETKGPLRFILIHGKTSRLRIVCNNIGFDMQSIGVIFQDLITVFISVQFMFTLQDLKTVGGSLIVVEMEKILQEKGDDLKHFWKHTLDVDIPEISLGDVNLQREVTFETFGKEKVTLTRDVYEALQRLSMSTGLSMFKLLASAYQLLLHLTSGEAVVVLLATVDVKQYIGSVSHAVGRGANLIPLLSTFSSDDVSCADFLKSNETSIQTSLDHCLCPLDVIEDLVSAEKFRNITRNKIVMVENDFSVSLSQLGKERGYTFDIVRAEDMGTHAEAQLSLWNSPKEKKMTLELTYNTNVISSKRAKTVMRALRDIAIKIGNDASLTIASLRSIGNLEEINSLDAYL